MNTELLEFLIGARIQLRRRTNVGQLQLRPHMQSYLLIIYGRLRALYEYGKNHTKRKV